MDSWYFSVCVFLLSPCIYVSPCFCGHPVCIAGDTVSSLRAFCDIDVYVSPALDDRGWDQPGRHVVLGPAAARSGITDPRGADAEKERRKETSVQNDNRSAERRLHGVCDISLDLTYRFSTPHGTSWIFCLKTSRPRKSRKIPLVLDSPGN